MIIVNREWDECFNKYPKFIKAAKKLKQIARDEKVPPEFVVYGVAWHSDTLVDYYEGSRGRRFEPRT